MCVHHVHVHMHTYISIFCIIFFAQNTQWIKHQILCITYVNCLNIYVCNVFSHWLRPCSAINRKRPWSTHSRFLIPRCPISHDDEYSAKLDINVTHGADFEHETRYKLYRYHSNKFGSMKDTAHIRRAKACLLRVICIKWLQILRMYRFEKNANTQKYKYLRPI